MALTSFQLKIIGVILMVLDHIHEMFPYVEGLTWMNMLGRMVMPIFLYLCAESFHYTRDRKKYALRLYMAGVLMAVASLYIGTIWPFPDALNINLMNNVFMTMFLSVVVMQGITFISNKSFLRGIMLLGLPMLPIAILPAVLGLGNLLITRSVIFLLPSYVSVEGGFGAILLATLFYIFRGKKKWQMLVLVAMAFLSTGLKIDTTMLLENYQWMMVFAIIPLLMYNGKKGKGWKYFFYIFYPAHIYILYFLSY